MDLQGAADRWRAAQAAVPRAEARAKQLVADARTAREKARLALAAAIVAADQQGMKQTEIVAITGYTRETVRRIIRDAEQ